MRGSFILSASFLVIAAGTTMKPPARLLLPYSTADTAPLISSEDTATRHVTDPQVIFYRDRLRQWGLAVGNYCARKYQEFAPILRKWLSTNRSESDESSKTVREEKPSVDPRAFLYLAADTIPGFSKIFPLASSWWLTDMDIPFAEHAKNFFVQSPYFEKYGYRYVMEGAEDPSGAEIVEETEEALDYQPLRDEADYYYEEIQVLEEESLPSDPTGSFDIYWEITDPNLL